MITVTAFKWVPPFARGLVRDLRVRWALEEAGLAYAVERIGPETQSTGDYRAVQPFGQVPVLKEDGFALFESGSIVLHIAERSAVLMPTDAQGRARTMTWVFAALNSVEPVAQALGELDFFSQSEEEKALRHPALMQRVGQRLDEVSTWLGGKDHLEGRFTAGDLMMTTVLRSLRHTDLVTSRPALQAYQERCETRPAFGRALRSHMESFDP